MVQINRGYWKWYSSTAVKPTTTTTTTRKLFRINIIIALNYVFVFVYIYIRLYIALRYMRINIFAFQKKEKKRNTFVCLALVIAAVTATATTEQNFSLQWVAIHRVVLHDVYFGAKQLVLGKRRNTVCGRFLCCFFLSFLLYSFRFVSFTFCYIFFFAFPYGSLWVFFSHLSHLIEINSYANTYGFGVICRQWLKWFSVHKF